jgi:hypothetical protein
MSILFNKNLVKREPFFCGMQPIVAFFFQDGGSTQLNKLYARESKQVFFKKSILRNQIGQQVAPNIIIGLRSSETLEANSQKI